MEFNTPRWLPTIQGKGRSSIVNTRSCCVNFTPLASALPRIHVLPPPDRSHTFGGRWTPTIMELLMRSMSQKGALIFGVAFLLVGVSGLFVPNGMSMDANMETAGRLLGLFPVNMLHNAIHIAFGAWGIVASRSHAGSRNYGKISSVVYGLLVVLAFIDPTTFGMVPIGSHDIWLHAVLAAGLAFIGFGPSDAPAAASR